MKTTKLRFIIFCFTILCIVFVPITNPVFTYKSFKDEITYYFFTDKINKDIPQAKIIDNGNTSIVICNQSNSSKIKKNLNYIYGESVRISNYSKEKLVNIVNEYNDLVVKTELIDNYKIILCYDKMLPKFVTIDNQKVNVQIAISTNEINIGYPLILNGF